MNIKQKTIQQSFSLSGTGLHTGNRVSAFFKPAIENHGICFVRVDLPGKPEIKACPENIHPETGLLRCSTISNHDAVVHTVEHLMSVLAGLAITNLTVELDGNELPGLDGSGLEYLQAIKKAGIVEQNADAQYFQVMETVGVSQGNSSIYIFPDNDFKISYTLDYDHPKLRSQFVSLTLQQDIFEKDIAPCRTFCLESEALELKKRGLGQGANYKNTLVVGKDGVIENQLRFSDEFARHKVLDMIGDLYLLGMPIKGRIFAVKSGHALNLALLKKISEQQKKFEKCQKTVYPDFSGKNEININEIMKIIPHRYPFLLVDRVVEIEKGKRAVGLKNVTINDNFFAGHFPTRPVMPGVLMIEAMAQTAGVVVLTNEAHRGKVAFFMSVDNVKFRKVVVPGDQLWMEVEVVKDKQKFAQIHAQAKVNNEVVVEADMVFSFADASYLD